MSKVPNCTRIEEYIERLTGMINGVKNPRLKSQALS